MITAMQASKLSRLDYGLTTSRREELDEIISKRSKEGFRSIFIKVDPRETMEVMSFLRAHNFIVSPPKHGEIFVEWPG